MLFNDMNEAVNILAKGFFVGTSKVSNTPSLLSNTWQWPGVGLI